MVLRVHVREFLVVAVAKDSGGGDGELRPAGEGASERRGDVKYGGEAGEMATTPLRSNAVRREVRSVALWRLSLLSHFHGHARRLEQVVVSTAVNGLIQSHGDLIVFRGGH